MASIGHVAVGMAAARIQGGGAWRMALWSALSLLPDADVIYVNAGVLAPDAVPARIAALERQLAAEASARDAARQSKQEAALRAAEERTVTCAGCSTVVRQRESFLSARGPLCTSCHLEAED